jgi:transposase
MGQKSGIGKAPTEQIIKDVRRAIRKQYSAEEKIRIVLEGLRGEESIAALCRREGIAESLYDNWSKEFLEAGKKRLAGDTARATTSDDVKVLCKEARDLKEGVAEQALELRILKKHDRGWGRRRIRYPASEKLEIIRLVEQSHRHLLQPVATIRGIRSSSVSPPNGPCRSLRIPDRSNCHGLIRDLACRCRYL